ncbi:hypothetical protein J2Y46_001524 [Microbacterium sp. BE35]|uniref:hypothetical protein n=1 Tax=Microbacterium sp. BE35 TaxID=2817773 RepID=UPI002865E4BC|nr:hypothetical protein [Microbacterium sp. BE35]MDR7188701.1 hypothetical protein [Microbacterium sp. BE35]
MAITTLFFDTPLPPTAAVTWLGAAGAFAAGAVGVLCMRDKLASLLAWLVLLTSLFGFFQYFALRAGFIPFVELYRAPGYASVEANAPAILLYIRRPFAQFPEPSFMAGSLTLAVLAMLLIARYFGRTRLRRVEKAAVLAGAIVIVLSESGSAVAGLGAIAVALLASSARSIGAQIRAALLIVLAAAGAIWVIEQRSSILNFSWGDRMMSIIASAQFWASDIQTFLFGLGRGGLTAAYSSGRVDVSGFQFTQQPPDVFSAIGRVLFESGLFAGGAVLLILVLLIVRGGALVAPLFSVAMITAWLVVGGITISYESAAFIWLLPGVCMGVIAVRRGSGNE